MKRKTIFTFLVLTLLIICNTLHGQEKKRTAVNDTTYMLTYDHGGLILWGSNHFTERLRNAISWLDKYKSFKIGLDNEAYIYDYFAENEPDILNELKGYLDKYKGRFGIGSSTYGQPLSQFVNDESNIRQIAYALKAEEKYFNYRPPVYLMSEHAMHSQIPQILNGFGYKGAIMRTHFMMYGYNPVFDLPIGWWEGFDGSEIAAIPTYPGEGAEFFKTTVDTWILTRYPSKESPDNMESFRKRFIHINPLLASRADDSGLRKEELVKEYDRKPKFTWVLLDDLLAKYPAPAEYMKTLPNDFKVRMPWGYCGNEIWNSSRRAETYILAAERLAALEMAAGGSSHEDMLDASWKELLLAQHHDIQICGLLPDARRLLPSSSERSEKLINEALQFFGERMSGSGVKQVIVFNPLSWKQKRWITTTLDISGARPKNYVARCGDNEVPVFIISPNASTDGKNIEVKGIFLAELDPLSINSYIITGTEKIPQKGNSGIHADEKTLFVKTPYYEISLAKNGGIASIRDSKTGEVLISGPDRAAFLEGKINGNDYCAEGKWVISGSAEGTPWIKMTEYGFISDIPYTFEMICYEDNPRIDCHVRIDFNGQMIGRTSDNKRDNTSAFVHEDKLRFRIFPSIDTTSFGIRDLPFAIAETNDKYVEGNYWSALSDGKKGIAYFNKGNMGSVREKGNSFSIPLAYSMYYIWGTRMLYGTFEYEFAVLPFKGDWRTAGLHTRAVEYNMPLPYTESRPGNGSLGYKYSPFSFSGEENIIVTALYPQNGKTVARLFNFDDTKPFSYFSVKSGQKIVREARMDGTIINNIPGDIKLKPWEIKTLLIED